MTLDPVPSPHAGDRLAVRDVLVIVLAGAALGIGFNAMQLDANPSRALSWVKSERHVASLQLESSTPPVPVTPTASPAAPAPAPGTPTTATAVAAAPAPGTPATAPAVAPAHATAPPPSAHAATTRPPAVVPPGAHAAPAPAPPAATTTAAAPAGDVPVIPDSRDPIEAGLDVVRRLHAAGAALFVDARTAEEYAEGHIAGAINVSFDDVFKNPALVKSIDAKGRPIVSYCGGGDCELSRSLGFSLIDAGQRKVLVFKEGLPAWQAAGLAVHKGGQP